jgi:hypothetical protein
LSPQIARVPQNFSVARSSLLLAAAMALAPRSALAQIELQGFLGSSVSAPSPLSISQRSQPDIHSTAYWATRPFTPTWYYAARLGLWRGGKGWLFDFTHHKAYMRHPPPPIQQFDISNGINMLTLSRGFRRGKLSWAVGGGPVVTFPISKVRGQELQRGRGFFGGYFLSGATAMGSVTRTITLRAGFFLSLDGRASATYVRVPVADGHAAVANFALHGHVGFGYSLAR